MLVSLFLFNLNSLYLSQKKNEMIMIKNYFLLMGCLWLAVLSHGQSPLLKADREAILSMEGCHTLIFDFAEIFPKDSVKSPPYHAEGVEYVKVIENQPDLISLQHLLVINDTMVIKHWRQDWILNAEKELNYQADKWWEQNPAPKGNRLWTQKVYQVDDGPRYSGTGQWVHAANRSYWQGEGDSPLPRREFTKRDDYNVVHRRSHIEINDAGWMFEQDNKKILRQGQIDEILAYEKGHEEFMARETRDCQPAIDYWKEQHVYWSLVRDAWDQIYLDHDKFKIEVVRPEGKLYARLFALGDSYIEGEKSEEETQAMIKQLISEHLTTPQSSK